MSFRSQGIEAPPGFAGAGFIVRPLLPSDNELDHAAVMVSRDFLYHWEQEPPYPPEDHSLEVNLADLERMRAEHEAGTRYTFTVMDPGEREVLGCLYFFPNDDRMFGSAVVTSDDGTNLSSVGLVLAFWVRVDTWGDGFERTLLQGVRRWVAEAWSVDSAVVVTNEALDHQIRTIESLGMTRRFSYDRKRDLYTSLAYA